MDAHRRRLSGGMGTVHRETTGGSYGDKTRQSFRANSLDTIWDRGKSLSMIAVLVDVLMRELYDERLGLVRWIVSKPW